MANFCGNCGTALLGEDPKTCSVCLTKHYLNPLPVAVAVLPVVENGETLGAVGVLRSKTSSIGAGKWGFPGGFLNLNENFSEGAARELLEETGIRVDPSKGQTIDTRISSNGANILVFIQFPALSLRDVLAATPDLKEVDDVNIVNNETDFAFSTHHAIFDLFVKPQKTPKKPLSARRKIL